MSHASDPLLIDVTRLVWRAWRGIMPTGIDRTCRAYAAHYRNQALAVVQRGGWTRVLPPPQSRALFSMLLDETHARPRMLRFALGALQSHARASLAGQLYLNVGHTGLNWPGHMRWIAQSGVRPVYFVHDLIPLTHPEYCRPGEAEKHCDRLRNLLGSGIGVIANSEDTLRELGAFAQRDLPQAKMPEGLVAPLGVDRLINGGAIATPALPDRPYFVMLGTIEGRKNHLLILNIWADMARRLGADCPHLVIIGQRGWESEQVVDMLERSAALKGHVTELARCDDADLAAYLRGARALLFPSFVEGYGLPLVEALALGTPVIASDLGVFRELACDIPDYLSAIDGLGWSRLIADYARADSPARAAQMARLTAFTLPSWKTHFSLVDTWLARLPAGQPIR